MISRNALTLLVSNGGSAFLSFALSVLIGRALGENGLGVYAAVLAWVFPLSLAADFGLSTLITRDVAQSPASAHIYLRAGVWSRLLIGGGLMLLLMLAAPLISNDDVLRRGLLLSAPLVIVMPFFGLFTALFRAYQIMWPIPWLNLVMLIVQVALTTLVFLSGAGILAALAVNTLTSAAQLIAAWGIWRWKFLIFYDTEITSPDRFEASLNPLSVYGEGRGGVKKPMPIRPLLRRAWPFAVAGLLAALQTRAGTILLEQLSNTAAVGHFAAATRFVEAARMIPNALFGALLPGLAALALNPAALNHTFRRMMFALAAFGAVSGLIFWLTSDLVLRLTYGESFAPATPALQILMIGLLPALLRAGRTLYCYALGREQFTNIVTAIALVAQIILSLWLIPPHGASGAALAFLISDTLALALLLRPISQIQTLGNEAAESPSP